jgi:hypothetical protein
MSYNSNTMNPKLLMELLHVTLSNITHRNIAYPSFFWANTYTTVPGAILVLTIITIFDISKGVYNELNAPDLWPFTELFDFLWKKPFSADLLENRLLYMHENLCIIKLWLAENTCAFVLYVQLSSRGLLPLKVYDFFVKF